MVNPADQQYVRRVVETLGEDEARMLPDLDVGEAILSGQLVNLPVLVKMKEPRSRGGREEQDAFAALEQAHRQSSQPPYRGGWKKDTMAVYDVKQRQSSQPPYRGGWKP